MQIGIVGLGLIGGSFAKALAQSDHTVLAYDADSTVLHYAQMAHLVQGELDQATLGGCDFLLLALYPQAAAQYLAANAPYLKKNAIVVDTGGTKREICQAGFALSEQYGFLFCGAHPMAGTQYSGIRHARADLFRGATLILTPRRNEDLHLLSAIKSLALECGFAGVTVTTPEEHDAIIAFTSQLAHVVSSAYIKSPAALRKTGFTAGSFQDMTRVAQLNEEMWTQLFLENRDNLLTELDTLLANLTQYRTALAQNDAAQLKSLLAQGRICKEATLDEGNTH